MKQILFAQKMSVHLINVMLILSNHKKGSTTLLQKPANIDLIIGPTKLVIKKKKELNISRLNILLE